MKMPGPFSEDLAWRVVFMRLLQGKDYAEIADLLAPMSVSGAWGIVQRFEQTGEVAWAHTAAPRQTRSGTTH